MAVAPAKATVAPNGSPRSVGHYPTPCPPTAPAGELGHSSRGRELWVDVAKGVGILAVIVGHSGAAISHYLYWFHMPLFFALSGYLFRPPAQPGRSWFMSRARRLLLPYAGFMVLLTLVRHTLMPGVSWSTLPGELPYLLAGGRFLTSLYGVVWFVTTLFVTQLLFAGLIHTLPRWWQQLLVLAVTYGLAHAQAAWWRTPRIPGNADVALLALTYYALGFYAHQLLGWVQAEKPHPRATAPVASTLSGSASSSAKARLSAWVLARLARLPRIPWPLSLAGAWAAALAWVAAERSGWLSYNLDMKYLVYTHPVLDLLIPLVWGVAVSLTCWAMARLPHTVVRPLSYLGRQSMPLMYLHFPVNSVLRAHTHYYGPVPFVLVGLFGSLALIWLFERIPFTRRALLGLPPVPPTATRTQVGRATRSSQTPAPPGSVVTG